MYFVGIDWADLKHDVAVLNEKGEKVLGFTVKHSSKGVETLCDALSRINMDRSAFACIIETNNGLIVEALLAAGFPIYPVNPKLANARRKASGAKTDPLDAVILANLGRSELHELRRLTPNSELAERLRGLTRKQLVLINQRAAVINRLKACLKRYFPVALQLFSRLTSRSALAFLERYLTLDEARKATVPEIEGLLRSNRFPHSSRKAVYIHSLLWKEHLRPGAATLYVESLEAKLCIQQLQLLNEQVESLDRLINELFEQHPAHGIFESLPGAGLRLAPALLAEWGDAPDRYSSASVVQALAGTSPVLYQSGKYRYARQRKSCVKPFRRALHLFARTSTRCCTWANEYYRGKIRDGKNHHAALRALANVWVRIIFAMVMSQEKYAEERFLRARELHAQAA